MYCIHCGNKVNSTDNFCDKCGTNLSNNQNLNNQPKENKSTNVSLILGIIACCLFFIPFISVPLAIIAIILGIINRKEQKTTGVILGGISLFLTIVEIILLVSLVSFITNKIINSDFSEQIKEIIEENIEINGNSFIASDNSIVEFNFDGSYTWNVDKLNYNKGNYISYVGPSAYNYAKSNLTGFNIYEYDIEDFYLIIMMPTEIMVNGTIIEEANTVYYYGEYDSDDKELELYNHNTGNYLTLTLYDKFKITDINI